MHCFLSCKVDPSNIILYLIFCTEFSFISSSQDTLSWQALLYPCSHFSSLLSANPVVYEESSMITSRHSYLMPHQWHQETKMENVTKELGQIWKQRYWSNAEMDLMYTKEGVITCWRMMKIELLRRRTRGIRWDGGKRFAIVNPRTWRQVYKKHFLFLTQTWCYLELADIVFHSYLLYYFLVVGFVVQCVQSFWQVFLNYMLILNMLY